VVERAGWRTPIIAATDVQDETTIVLENAVDLTCERQEPLYILSFFGVSVLLLEMEGVWRRGENEVDAR
jgi:hypothetical protein